MAVGGGEADTLWTDFLRRRAWPGLGADRLGERSLHAGRSRVLVQVQRCRIAGNAPQNTLSADNLRLRQASRSVGSISEANGHGDAAMATIR
jgi:hypothetical protein